jgi:hypothetical protein
MAKNEPETTDDFLTMVKNMAARMGLEGKEEQKYVHEHMTRAGYSMVPSYVKDDESEENEDTDFFGNKKKAKRTGDMGTEDKAGGSGGWF